MNGHRPEERIAMFYKKNDQGYREAVKGVMMKTLVHGEKTLLTEFRLKAGEYLPRHNHIYEQTGYLVSGAIVLFVEGESFSAEPGDSWCVPANAEHGAKIVEDSVAIEVFSPLREDYLP